MLDGCPLNRIFPSGDTMTMVGIDDMRSLFARVFFSESVVQLHAALTGHQAASCTCIGAPAQVTLNIRLAIHWMDICCE